MYQFIDGAFAATTAGSIWVAIWNYVRRKSTAQLHKEEAASKKDELFQAAVAHQITKKALGIETSTLEAWTKHLDEEAKVDYTALVARLKHLSQ